VSGEYFFYLPINHAPSLKLWSVGDSPIRTGKEIRFRFWLSEDKAGKEAKRRPTGW